MMPVVQLRPLNENLLSDLMISRLNLQCPYGWMDYALGVIEFGVWIARVCVLVARWINLGAGQDSADVKWKSYITVHIARGIHHLHHPKDVRTGFEDQAEVSVEEVTVDNKPKLFSRRQT
jgi:hypothetical protein